MSEIEVLKENIKEIQLRITGITKDKDSLKDKIEELRLKAPESIDFNEELLNNSIEELISEKVLLTEKKEKLGKLNFEAEDFFQVAEASYLSFKKEYDDITEAVKRLKQMLKGIEAEVRRLFNKTFPKIQKAFEKIFEYFFPGGKGEIVFEGSDIFSSRIYLRAVPSGKKTKRLIQLSDGEKAMLGISFLFSLFEISPAPFLLLDELDAPLDDKNIIKFSEYLKHIKKITQIIVVTHNKKTMEIADRLLGVTEDRPGISKVVSVNLKEVV